MKTSDPIQNKSLPKNAFEKLNSFVGYGNLRGPVWFLGMEEGMDTSCAARIKEQIMVRTEQFEMVEDCQTALKKLNVTRWNDERQSTWGGMSAIMVALRGADPREKTLCLKYQASLLGTNTGETLLTELLPLPKKGHSDWPPLYNELGFKGITDYRRRVLPERIKMLKGLIHQHRPSVIICYGKMEWKSFKKELFDGVTFDPDKTDAKIEAGAKDHTLILLMWHFARNQISAKQIERVVEIIKQRFPGLCKG